MQYLEWEALLELLVSGGYPPAVARQSPARRDAWFQSYVMTMLQRDIRDLANIADSTAIPRLLSVVATRAGSLLNFADLSRTMALPQTTLKRYFALLERTFLTQLLRPWARALGKRVIETPKVYLNDSGLLICSLRATSDRLKAEGNLTGAVLENFVMMELRIAFECRFSRSRTLDPAEIPRVVISCRFIAAPRCHPWSRHPRKTRRFTSDQRPSTW